MRTTRVLAVLVALGLLGPTPVLGQPTAPVDSFDLVLVGARADALQDVALKSNPWQDDAWVPVGDRATAACPSESTLRVIPNLPTDRFLGQDIRENYIALKIEPTDAGHSLRAAYALPSIDQVDRQVCSTLAHLIATEPSTLRLHSLAAHARPRPASLSGPDPFIEHLEAAVRHRKPGVMEVEWLEILFGSEE